MNNQVTPTPVVPPTAPAAQAPQPDVQALALTKAIRQKESGGNYSASGDNATSAGAYQFQAATWKNYAQQILGNPNAPMSEDNQNAVAYGMVKTWKDQGLGPAEIAAKWNSGSEKGWENKIGTTTRNGKPLEYNVPQYVNDVVTNFKSLYPQVAAQYGEPSSGSNPLIPTAEASTNTSQPAPAIEQPHKDVLDSLTHFFNAIFPGKQVGDAIGTLAGYGLSGAQGTSQYYDTSAPSPLQTVGDAAQMALAVGSGMPGGSEISLFGKEIPAALPVAKSVLGRIAGQTALGAGFGLTGSVARGDNLNDTIQNTKSTALISGALGISQEAVSAVLSKLPAYVTQKALSINPKVLENKPGLIDQALNDMSFGTKSQMEKTSQGLIDTYSKSIDGILKSPEYADVVLNGKEAAKMVTEAFPDSNLTPGQVSKIVKQVAPEAAGLYDRFVSEGLNMVDTNRLRSLIDQSTNSYYTRNAVAPFSKEVAVSLADTLRQAVQEGAPETAPIFSKYTREIAIHGSLQRIQKAPTFKVGVKDLLLAGATHLGLGVGSLPAFIAEEVASNPTVRLNAAKAAYKAAPAVTGALEAARLPTLTASSRSK